MFEGNVRCSDDELRNGCNLILLHVMGVVPVHRSNVAAVLRCAADALQRCSWWKARVLLLKFLQVSVFANVFLMARSTDDICKLVFACMNDAQLEVRTAAADTLSGFINCGIISVNEALLVSR